MPYTFPMPRQRLSAGQRREDILAAASDLFIAYGFEGVSMGMLAEANHTSRPNIYFYFPNTEAILDVLIEKHLEAIQPDLHGLVVPGQPLDFAKLFEVLGKHRRLILLLNCGGSADLRAKREAFDDAMIGGMAQALGSERLTKYPLLLPLVSGVLRGVVHETIVRETPTADPQEIAPLLSAFVTGGQKSVIEALEP